MLLTPFKTSMVVKFQTCFTKRTILEENKRIVITDDLLRLKESFHFQNFKMKLKQDGS